MVKETRIILEPRDFTALVVSCQNCAGELRFEPGTTCSVPDTCPYCKEMLKPIGSVSDADHLLALLHRLAGESPQRLHSVRLETAGESEDS